MIAILQPYKTPGCYNFTQMEQETAIFTGPEHQGLMQSALGPGWSVRCNHDESRAVFSIPYPESPRPDKISETSREMAQIIFMSEKVGVEQGKYLIGTDFREFQNDGERLAHFIVEVTWPIPDKLFPLLDNIGRMIEEK